MKSQARVVVIGGGIAGCSTLYHLTQEGWSDVLLVERDELTSGSTWHAAAQVTNFGAVQTMVGLKSHSIRLYQELAVDEEFPFAYPIMGGARLAHNDDHIDGYKHFVSMAKGMGVDFEVLDAAETCRRHPLRRCRSRWAKTHDLASWRRWFQTSHLKSRFWRVAPMWFPLSGIPWLVEQGLEAYRDIFCRDAGFAHVSRYVTGLLLSANKGLEGIHARQVWPLGEERSRRAMHTAVFEAGWDSEGLLPRHREVVSAYHRGRGLEVMSLDWTLIHHDRGPQIDATKRAYDYVEGRQSNYQMLVTAVVANAERVDGIAVEVQVPDYGEQERAYLAMMQTEQDGQQLEAARQRIVELLHYHKNRLNSRKCTEIAVEIVTQLEAEGRYPQVPYAFDNGVLSLPFSTVISSQLISS